MQRFFSQLIPFLLLGFAVVAFTFSIMLLAYLFFFGALIGMGLYLISWVKQKFFPPKNVTKPLKKRTGRIIDTDDWKKL
jgi:hypothetical protein